MAPPREIATDYYIALSSAALSTGNLEEARKAISLAKALGPGNIELLRLELELAQSEGNSATVLEVAGKLQDKTLQGDRGISNLAFPASQFADGLLAQAEAHASLGQYPVALDLARRAVSL